MKLRILGVLAVTLMTAGVQPARAAMYTYTYTFGGGQVVNGTVDGTFDAGADPGSAADDFLSSVTVLSANYNGTAFASSSLSLLNYPGYTTNAKMYFSAGSNGFIISGCNPGACPATLPSPWQYFVLRPVTAFEGPGYYNSSTGDLLEDRGALGSWTLIEGVTDPSPVPLPAAAWLLVSGLGGLGFLGPRRKAA